MRKILGICGKALINQLKELGRRVKRIDLCAPSGLCGEDAAKMMAFIDPREKAGVGRTANHHRFTLWI